MERAETVEGYLAKEGYAGIGREGDTDLLAAPPGNPAPDATYLAHDQTVQDTLATAWDRSNSSKPFLRHEEGGWVYANRSGDIDVRFARPGGTRTIDLSNPPELDDEFVVAKFHTHPNPSSEGWTPGPSPQDVKVDWKAGVPDLIRSDSGDFISGPPARVGGLAGPPGFPNTAAPNQQLYASQPIW